MIPVFNIERFAIHDGVGIRTTVFLQGCPMRCEWCANPESQTIGTHIMHNKSRCTACGKCNESCPEGCIDLSSGTAHIDRTVCTLCGKCAEVCLNDSMTVSGKMMTCDEIFQIVVRDKDYYESSGGGVTFSGGEALIHIEKLLPLLEKLKNENIGIAFETCGCVPVKSLETALEYTDCFLFDLKSLDKEKLKKHTGGAIETILSAFEFLCREASQRVIVRVPVIPDFNFDEITKITDYAKTNGIIEMHILPYHTLGMSKYEQLGREYPFACRTALPIDKVEPFSRYGKSIGLTVKIGG